MNIMKSKQIWKMTVDILMTVALLLLMAYSLVYGSNPAVGEAVHEWLGIGIFVLFVLHHFLNRKWSLSIHKGKYTPYRVVQTTLVVLILFAMCGSMVSGILLSRTVFSFLGIRGGQAAARIVHMLCAYWEFVFLSLHLGLHWRVMMGMAGKLIKKSSKGCKWILRMTGALIAGYGAYAFIKRDFGNYMLLRYHFMFLDFEEPLALFLLDHVAIMGLFVYVGYYISVRLIHNH